MKTKSNTLFFLNQIMEVLHEYKLNYDEGFINDAIVYKNFVVLANQNSQLIFFDLSDDFKVKKLPLDL